MTLYYRWNEEWIINIWISIYYCKNHYFDVWFNIVRWRIVLVTLSLTLKLKLKLTLRDIYDGRRMHQDFLHDIQSIDRLGLSVEMWFWSTIMNILVRAKFVYCHPTSGNANSSTTFRLAATTSKIDLFLCLLRCF